MLNLIKFAKLYLGDTRGATMIEYGLIAALIAVALIAALGGVATGLGNLFGNVENEVG